MVSIEVRNSNPHQNQPHHSRGGCNAVYNTVKPLTEAKHAIIAVALRQYKALLLPTEQSDPRHFFQCHRILCAGRDVHVLTQRAGKLLQTNYLFVSPTQF